MIIGFGNNVVSSLAADITATQTTIQVMPGTGTLFAGLLTYDYANDSNPLKTYAKITLTDAKETVFEVCHLTSANNDMLTVVRGQEGTAAKGWSLNDVIANFATRGSENQFVQIEQLQSGHYTSAVAGGTANGLTLALPATYFLNGSTDWALKTPILIYPALNNTGASTLQLTMGGRVMGTYPLVKGSDTVLRAGDIVAKNPFLVVFNADQGRFVVLNPTTDVGSVRSVNTIGPDAGGNVALPMYGLGMGPQHKSDAFSDVAQIYRINSSSASAPGNSVYGVICLPCDGAPSASYLAAGNNGELHVGRSTTVSNGVAWNRVYTTAYKPTAQDVGAWSKTEADNRFVYKTGDTIAALNVTKGLFVGENATVDGGLAVNGTSFINKTGVYSFHNDSGDWRQTNGIHLQGFGDQFADIYFSELLGQYAALSIHAKSGDRDAWIEFRHNGEFRINGSEVAPVGMPQPWPLETPPAGWLKCNGQSFNKSQYPLLASAYPSGALPDLRGEFIRVWDDGRGVNPGRGILSSESDALQDHGHKAIRLRNLGGGGGQTAIPDGGSNFTNDLDLINGVSSHDYNGGTPRIAGETRPRNIAFNYIVRAA